MLADIYLLIGVIYKNIAIVIFLVCTCDYYWSLEDLCVGCWLLLCMTILDRNNLVLL